MRACAPVLLLLLLSQLIVPGTAAAQSTVEQSTVEQSTVARSTVAQSAVAEHLARCAEQRDRSGGLQREAFCEARTFDIAAGSPLWLEPGQGRGGVRVVGRPDGRAQVIAVIGARAPTRREARALLDRVTVHRAHDVFRVEGPPADGWGVWWVEFVVAVPAAAAVELTVAGGGAITVHDMAGAVRVTTDSGVVEFPQRGGG